MILRDYIREHKEKLSEFAVVKFVMERAYTGYPIEFVGINGAEELMHKLEKNSYYRTALDRDVINTEEMQSLGFPVKMIIIYV